MGVIRRIVEQRAEAETAALIEAREVCINKKNDIDVRISAKRAEEKKAQKEFYIANDSGDESTVNSLLRNIKTCQTNIKNLQREKESWEDLESILSQIESLIFLMQQHGQYWGIIHALPYRKLKKERYSFKTVQSLIEEFDKIYEVLRANAWRLTKQEDEFAHRLGDADRTYSSLDKQAKEAASQKDAISKLRQELLDERNNSESTLEPVENPRAETENDDRKRMS